MATIATNAVRGDELRLMIHNPAVNMAAIASALDALGGDHDARYLQARRLGWRDLRALYALAAESEPLDVDHLVPTEARGEPVVHDGWNSIPLPGVNLFQKVFVRPEGADEDVIWGYNDGPLKPIVGPGYFVAKRTSVEPGWTHRGGLVVDYFETPPTDGRVPDAWPTIVPNSVGLQRFVFDGTRDFLRRVSTHMAVGAAFKGEFAIETYFVLVRRPTYDA